MENSVTFLFSGDSALVMEFGNEISVDINKKIRKMMDNIKKEDRWNCGTCSNLLFFTCQLRCVKTGLSKFSGEVKKSVTR